MEDLPAFGGASAPLAAVVGRDGCLYPDFEIEASRPPPFAACRPTRRLPSMKSADKTGVASARSIVYVGSMSVNEIKKAIEHLSIEERLELMQWLNQSADDEWDLQMKRDAAAGKFDKLIKEAEADYRDGRTTEFP